MKNISLFLGFLLGGVLKFDDEESFSLLFGVLVEIFSSFTTDREGDENDSEFEDTIVLEVRDGDTNVDDGEGG